MLDLLNYQQEIVKELFLEASLSILRQLMEDCRHLVCGGCKCLTKENHDLCQNPCWDKLKQAGALEKALPRLKERSGEVMFEMERELMKRHDLQGFISASSILHFFSYSMQSNNPYGEDPFMAICTNPFWKSEITVLMEEKYGTDEETPDHCPPPKLRRFDIDNDQEDQ